jgi:L,D-transpeptidase ErfK/SrfK
MKTKYLARAFSAVGILFFATSSLALAETYPVPATENNIIGEPIFTSAQNGDTLISIAQRFDVGLNAISAANPDVAVTARLPAGTHVDIPGSHLLPPLPHKGIVINLPEMRMYYYSSEGVVKTYPIGIGRVGKTIPLAHTAVVRKAENPVWIPPEDIRAFNLEQGIVLPRIMPSGPDNPLGPMAIYLQIPTYLIHSTIYPDSVGRRASFGCIRMHESDIKDFFPLVTPGTAVTIVDMPTKVGWQGKNLYLETYIPLEEHSTEYYAGYEGMVSAIQSTTGSSTTFVDWQAVSDLADARDGTPHNIGFQMN